MAVFAYRPGFLWAWLAMWLVPLHATIDIAIITASGGWSIAAGLWDLGWASAMVVALIVDHPSHVPNLRRRAHPHQEAVCP